MSNPIKWLKKGSKETNYSSPTKSGSTIGVCYEDYYVYGQCTDTMYGNCSISRKNNVVFDFLKY